VARRSRKFPKSSALAILLLVVFSACSRERSATPRHKKSKASAKTATAEASGPRTEVGDVMPPYSTKLLDGKPFDLKSEKGSVVLLNVWASWCQPCRFETPELQALHQKYGARGFKVIGVSVDEGDPADVKKFIEETRITYPIALDAEGRIANVLRTTVLPTSVLISRDGHIVWRKVGPVMPNETAEVDFVVQTAVGKKS
jgi:cytochrome c biogenesis protein CcmG/thiol:disulfide interchange protein DsbE